MERLRRRALLAYSAALFFAPKAFAEDETAEVLAKVDRARAAVRTLRGPFAQTRLIGLLAAEVRSHGTLSLVRPDRLRWQLDPPDDVTFWIGPEGLAYRSAHGEARIAPTETRIASALEDVRTVLGGDLTRLRERWILRASDHGAAGVELEAEAREKSPAAPRSMRLVLGPDLVRPTRAVLVEGPHDRTIIDFGDLTVNAPIDASAMRPP